ncbi:16S rRNA methyltransferase GidB [Candidatus Pantoea carbekii]|uniref:Ribosomal RNA small subunit methyltransferase G n=1 Tax=Candidatus Pantoea carbekii TaxID=1235990 RepID=U3U700_9GAMM|nr:16S rRNA methyltransferase GidB [Candidatus Pantoea carbekii]
MLNTLSALLKTINIFISDRQKQQLITYIELLCKWNKLYNFTSVRDPQQILVRHILDSIVVKPYLKGNFFIDVGTGPGLPGIPLAIVHPQANFTLLDSRAKKVRFLYQVEYELALNNINIINNRVEKFFTQLSFDGIISRAFAPLENMIKLCHHLLSDHGRFYALKGICTYNLFAKFSGAFVIEQIHPLQVPELNAERHLIIIKRSNEIK